MTTDEIHRKKIDTMRFTQNEVNLGVTDDGHQKSSKCS